MILDTVASVLKEKEKSKLVSVVPSTSVVDAVRTMNAENIGAVLVLDGQKLVGIFTERDVMVRVVGAKRDPATTLVSEVMAWNTRREPTMHCNLCRIDTTGTYLSWRTAKCVAWCR
jgi:CBS domain-containing protein